MKLKLIAIAAAMVSLAGGAQAAFTGSASNNGTISLMAVDIVTGNWYIRDTNFLMNDFLPSSVTTGSGDGGVTGNKTPEAGLTLDKNNTATFADASFSGWLAAQTAVANVRWLFSSYDNQGLTTGVDVVRLLASSANPAETVTNGQITQFTGSGQAAGLSTFYTSGGAVVISPNSRSGTNSSAGFKNAFGLGTDAMAMIDSSVSLFYAVRNPGTGASLTQSQLTKFGNSANFASVMLEADGDFSYTLAPAAAVPLPAAVWMMGAGLVAVGGVIRRRKAAAQA